MGIFEALEEIIATPIRVAKEVVDDFSGENDSADFGLALFTLGGSSIVKGIVKSIDKANERLE